ncbi:PR5-like receptor kinase [Trifolium pratense]|uniref:PR5-like receptor kinase n=1 Tax=Trifolium pratense TaxID=57577 RepID=UPI001E694355|nr:PR5-like receptor kinase [Trifolium pratense]
MARNTNGLVTLVFMLANFLHGSVATNFSVGHGSDQFQGGEDPITSSFKIHWGTERTLAVGDVLEFDYGEQHNVTMVTKSDFNSCNKTNLHTNSSIRVLVLKKVAQYYFICTIADHCSAYDEKLSINVANSVPAPEQPPIASSSAPNATTSPPSPATGSPSNSKRKVIIGVGSAAMVAFLMCIIIYCFRGKSLIQQVKFRFNFNTNGDKVIEQFLKNHGALSQKRYKFSEIKKMTNSFEIKLGQGGYGVVYKGKLFNGCLVAVKILNTSKGNGEEFINEVASITRTSHVNVVNLLGFCFESRKKALIYEFMSNGSLDKFIYNKGSETIASLSWDNLYQIAKGIARGLEYLHRGCNTRILHFDIKPHNILLDENFCPKISDFGLAKLCPRKESIISMSDQRGTMGYVAPEVWNRSFGGVSHKSDVYSYGMMLLEMVGGRKNINANASQTSEIYFPHWVYSRLELGNDLRPDGIMNTEEDDIARRMTIVGLWCIQTFPNDRPTMSKVIELLEVSMNLLQIPPKPLFSSPTRSD